MEEEYTKNGDLVMIEELDDISYDHNGNILNHVFIEDNSKKLIKKMIKI